MFLSSNLQFLRERAGLSRQKFADLMEIGPGAYTQYEIRGSVPPMEVLIKIANFYRISIDDMVRKKLSELNEYQLDNVFFTFYRSAYGNNLRILPITVGVDNQDNVELVPVKAKAGYITGGFEDPIFISELSQFRLPILPDNKKFRMFQIEGDSMHPIPSGAFVLGSYVTNWFDIREGKAYILITKEDIVFKLIVSRPSDRSADPFFFLASLNRYYSEYSVKLMDVLEIWEFTLYMSSELPPTETEDNSLKYVVQEIKGLRKEIQAFIKK